MTEVIMAVNCMSLLSYFLFHLSVKRLILALLLKLHSMDKLLLMITLLPFLAFCQSTTTPNSPVYPDKEWQFTNDAAKDGWSRDSLNNLKRFIIDSTDATGMVVVQSGKILFD